MRTPQPNHLFLCLLLFSAAALSNSQPMDMVTLGQLATSNSAANVAEGPTIDGVVGGSDSEFIRTSCNATLYPNVCYTSLKPYAIEVQDKPGKLACVAMTVTMTKVQRVASHIKTLEDSNSTPPAAKEALSQCLSNLDDAVDHILQSVEQMKKMEDAGTVDKMSDVQTWMSSALTFETTCSDKFKRVVECPMKKEVSRRVSTLTKVTSNALALANSYANGNKGKPSS